MKGRHGHPGAPPKIKSFLRLTPERAHFVSTPPASFRLPDPRFFTVNCGACDLSASPTTGRASQCPDDPDLTASMTIQCCGRGGGRGISSPGAGRCRLQLSSAQHGNGRHPVFAGREVGNSTLRARFLNRARLNPRTAGDWHFYSLVRGIGRLKSVPKGSEQRVMQETRVQSLVVEDRTCLEQLSPGTTTLEPKSCVY